MSFICKKCGNKITTDVVGICKVDQDLKILSVENAEITGYCWNCNSESMNFSDFAFWQEDSYIRQVILTDDYIRINLINDDSLIHHVASNWFSKESLIRGANEGNIDVKRISKLHFLYVLDMPLIDTDFNTVYENNIKKIKDLFNLETKNMAA